MRRTALVTGGNRGIGLAAARQLAEKGYAVVIGSRNPKDGEEAAEPRRRRVLDVSTVRLDLSAAATLHAAVAPIEASGRSVDVLINNAGILHEKPLVELFDLDVADSVAVHRTGPLRLLRSLAPRTVAGGYGRVVNVSSG